jgi:hypothetical protein
MICGVPDVDLGVAAGLGAVGGGIAEAVNLWGNLIAWQQARHSALRRQRTPPPVTRYIDPLADTLVALTRVAMGVGAGLLFHSQVTGVTAAIAVGAAAPALLAQVGAGRASRTTT